TVRGHASSWRTECAAPIGSTRSTSTPPNRRRQDGPRALDGPRLRGPEPRRRRRCPQSSPRLGRTRQPLVGFALLLEQDLAELVFLPGLQDGEHLIPRFELGLSD